MTSAEETYDLFTRGSFNRRVGQTEMNRESSRSHAVFTVTLESRRRAFPGAALQKRNATLHLVDLAGSERQKATEAGGARLKEASAINKSLSALGNVIKALVDVAEGKERHVPYRDSKLTYLLKDALGGRARCTLLACVSPAAGQMEETLSTLKFAQRAKMVKIKARANEEAEGSKDELAAEIARLRARRADGGAAGAEDAASRERVARLEQHVARANRVAAAAARAAAARAAAREARLDAVEELETPGHESAVDEDGAPPARRGAQARRRRRRRRRRRGSSGTRRWRRSGKLRSVLPRLFASAWRCRRSAHAWRSWRRRTTRIPRRVAWRRSRLSSRTSGGFASRRASSPRARWNAPPRATRFARLRRRASRRSRRVARRPSASRRTPRKPRRRRRRRGPRRRTAERRRRRRRRSPRKTPRACRRRSRSRSP